MFRTQKPLSQGSRLARSLPSDTADRRTGAGQPSQPRQAPNPQSSSPTRDKDKHGARPPSRSTALPAPRMRKGASEPTPLHPTCFRKHQRTRAGLQQASGPLLD